MAEESGGFVGFGVGYGDAKMIQENTNEYNANITDKASASANGASYGFVAGYKQFFNEYLGLHYYANVDLTHATFKITDFRPILLNYGANVDFLGNFISTDIVDFGGFIGLGIGANTLTGKYIKVMKDEIRKNGEKREKFNDTGFDIWLNVGLRTNIAKNHGIELVAKVPFIPVKFIEHKQVGGGDYDSITTYTFGQNVSVLARYTFSF